MLYAFHCDTVTQPDTIVGFWLRKDQREYALFLQVGLMYLCETALPL